jgi:hypothetical protein
VNIPEYMGFNFSINYYDYSWLNIDTSQTLNKFDELKQNFTNYLENLSKFQENLTIKLTYPKITNKDFEKRYPSLLEVNYYKNIIFLRNYSPIF